MRTGSEPTTARSALRARLWLSIWGLVWSVFGTVAFVLAGRPGWAAACAVLWLVVTVDLLMVLRHLRQGPHYQPGRDIPPYAPVDSGPARPGRPGSSTPERGPRPPGPPPPGYGPPSPRDHRP